VTGTGFGEAIRKAREARRLTKDELGRRVGVHPSYISRLEHGKRRPGDLVLRALCAELRLHLRDLIA
jgi:transcriptional regulator with XRE-family HTH domain